MKTNRTDKIRADLAAARAAIDTIEAALTIEASDEDVCDCPEGNAAGITEAECGCRGVAQMHAAAKTLEAFGCYVRRTKIGD